MTRPAAWIAAGLLATSFGCASWQANRARNKYLAQQLDAISYAKPMGEVWAEARRLLADKGYPLAGEDAKAVGQQQGWFLARLVSPSRETRVDGKGNWMLDSGWLKAVRYHLEGVNAGAGCRVVFTSIEQDQVDHRNESGHRDLQMELELARRVDPEAAARIEAGMAQPAGG